MKKTIVRICLVVFTGSILISCKKDDEPICPELSLEAVYPFAAPAGGPVLIKGTGFNEEDITVRFGTLKAEILEKNKNYISTKVPPGLLGVIEVSVANAQGCLVTKNFEVSSDPSTMAGSPPVYIIPPSGFAFPVQIPLQESLSFTNVYDPFHNIFLRPFREVMVIEYGDVDTEVNIEFLGDKKSPVSGNVNLLKNEINIKIDRSVKDDEFIGGFYTITLSDNGEEKKDNFFIAFSSVTGRQYVFYIIR